MHKKIKEESELLHSDETTMQCNQEEGRKASSNSYMWVLRSGELEERKGIIFKYSPSRSEKTAQEYIKETYNIDSTYSDDDDTIYIWTENLNENLNLAAAREYIEQEIGLEMVNVIYGKKQ